MQNKYMYILVPNNGFIGVYCLIQNWLLFFSYISSDGLVVLSNIQMMVKATGSLL
jgi:hypothetical protein